MPEALPGFSSLVSLPSRRFLGCPQVFWGERGADSLESAGSVWLRGGAALTRISACGQHAHSLKAGSAPHRAPGPLCPAAAPLPSPAGLCGREGLGKAGFHRFHRIRRDAVMCPSTGSVLNFCSEGEESVCTLIWI